MFQYYVDNNHTRGDVDNEVALEHGTDHMAKPIITFL